MRKRFFSLFAVLTLFFVAVGCGDDDPEPAATDDTEAEDTTPETTETTEVALALEDWAAEADDICADTDEAMGELEEPTSAEDIDAAIAFLEDAVAIQQDQLDALTELGAPDDEADAAEEALGLLNDQIELVEAAIADVEDGADLEEVIAGLNEEGDDIKADLTDLAEDLGLEVCGADSGSDEPPTTVDNGSSDEPFTYGDDADLDSLWEACDDGDPEACDTLWSESPVGSEYEDFGYSCGFRVPEGEVELCSDVLGTSSGDPFEYGDDAELDALWDACDGGDGQACDDLFFQSPFDSEYEAFGNTCGGRVDESEANTTYCADVM